MKRFCAAILFCTLLLTACASAPGDLSVPRDAALSETAEAVGYTPFLPTDWGMSEEEVLSALGWSEDDWAAQEQTEETYRTFVSRDNRYSFRFGLYPLQNPHGEWEYIDIGLIGVRKICYTEEELEEVRAALSDKFQPGKESERGHAWVMGPTEREHPAFAEFCRLLQKAQKASGLPSADREDFAEKLPVDSLSSSNLVDSPPLISKEDCAGYFDFQGQACARLNNFDTVAPRWEALLEE